MKNQTARNWVFLPGLLCLDAPIVAVGWAWLFSLCQSNWYPPLDLSMGLFFTVWSIYLFDRLYDSRKRAVRAEANTPLRHAWALRNRKLLGCLFCVSIMALAYFAFRLANQNILIKALLVGIASMAYFVIFLFLKIPSRGQLPLKEIMIGTCFAGGVFVGSGSSIVFAPRYVDAAMPSFLCGSAILFTWNCLLIGKSEQMFDRKTDLSSFHAVSGRKKISLLWFVIPLLVFGFGLLCKAWYFSGGLSLLVCGIGFYYLEKRPPNSRFVPMLADGILLFPWIVIGWDWVKVSWYYLTH